MLRICFIICLAIYLFIISSICSADEIGRYDFEPAKEYKLKGNLEYTLEFELEIPEEKDWKPYIKALLNYYNNTGQDVYTYIAVALFDAKGNLLSACSNPTFLECIRKPEGSMSVNLDFALAGYKIEDISYFLVNFKESNQPILPEVGSVSHPKHTKYSEKQFYDFLLGSNYVGENKIKFEFPTKTIDTLYLFHLAEWKGASIENKKLVVNLYDENRNLIDSGDSLCIKRNRGGFGSIPFPRVTRETVKNVTYFTASIQECGQ